MNRNEEGTTIRCSLADFAKSSCEAYEALAKQKLAKTSTPYVPDGSLLDTDWETKGVLAEKRFEDLNEGSVDGQTLSTRLDEKHWGLDKTVNSMVGRGRQTPLQTHDLRKLNTKLCT